MLLSLAVLCCHCEIAESVGLRGWFVKSTSRLALDYMLLFGSEHIEEERDQTSPSSHLPLHRSPSFNADPPASLQKPRDFPSLWEHALLPPHSHHLLLPLSLLSWNSLPPQQRELPTRLPQA